MMYESHTYKHNPKKVKEDNRDTLFIAAAVVLFVVVFIFFFRGLLGFAFLATLSGGLIKIKLDDIKKKGANRFGSLVETLTLTPDTLKIGDTEFKITELKQFEIEADDYLGRSTGPLGISQGTDNFIEFKHKGTDHSIQFQVKKYSDLKLIAEIGKEIKGRSEPH